VVHGMPMLCYLFPALVPQTFAPHTNICLSIGFCDLWATPTMTHSLCPPFGGGTLRLAKSVCHCGGWIRTNDLRLIVWSLGFLL